MSFAGQWSARLRPGRTVLIPSGNLPWPRHGDALLLVGAGSLGLLLRGFGLGLNVCRCGFGWGLRLGVSYLRLHSNYLCLRLRLHGSYLRLRLRLDSNYLRLDATAIFGSGSGSGSGNRAMQ